MADYPIVNRNQRQMAPQDHRRLPAFYMEDFSVLGLSVNDCDRAVAVLQKHQFVLKPSGGTMAVVLRNAGQASAAVGLLNRNGVACELADVAQGMYQG